MFDVQSATNLDELWKLSLGYMAVELSADRAVVMFDEDGNQEFSIVAHRRVDPHQIWTGSQIDLSLLKQVCKTATQKTVNQDGRALICAPVLRDNTVLAIVYGDRSLEDDPYSEEEGQHLADFVRRVAARMATLCGSKAGGARPVALAAEPAPPAPAPPRPAPAPLPPPMEDPEPAESARSARRKTPTGAVQTIQEPDGPPASPWTAPAPPPPAPPRPAPQPPVVMQPPVPQTWDAGGDDPGETLRPKRSQFARSSELVGGRFLLGKQLLVCRFSTLFEAVDRASQTPLVLRRLEGDAGSSREARQQTMREGRFLARLVHSNLPRVQEVIEDRGHVYLVLEEFAGKTLEEVGQEGEGRIPHEVLRRYLDQFLDVVGFLHNQDPAIVHRDLRPDSILVTTHGVLKLAEFGLARMRESRTDPRATAFRAQGSPCYAPPEQLLGEASGPNNDVYAMGAVLYYLATGTPPVKSVDRWYGAATLSPLSDLRPDLDGRFIQLIDWMMECDPEKRPGSVEEVQQRLDDLFRAAAVEEPLSTSQAVMVRPDFAAPAPTPSGAAAGGAATPTARRSSSPAKGKHQQQSTFGKLAERFGAWNFLLKGKKRPSHEVVIEEDAPIVEFTSDLAGQGDVDLAQLMVSQQLGRLLPETVAKAIQGVVIAQPSASEITVAVKDPTEVHIYDHIALGSQNQLRPTLVRGAPHLIDLAIEYVYRSNQYSENIPWNEWLERKSFEQEELQVNNPMADIAFGTEEITSPIIHAVDKMVKEAISVGASDIHMETYERGMDVRYRIDGQLYVIDHFSVTDASAMVKRLKVMANMDIAQEKVCQGGRISLKVSSQEFDLRVSMVPVPHGESVVMRILKKGAFNLTLSDLGFQKHTMEQFGVVLDQPYGMILVCGPTGSGKSTTLYASLKQIQRPDRKLLTVEDPIEYQMPGICQVQVNMAPREEEKRVTFARVLREFLRQDPDVILVGEIRDSETAAIAVQAALTGHLLLSTIHTNDSVGIIARLMDMGVEPFLIGSTFLGGLAQRLARRICSNCREECSPPAELMDILERENIRVDKIQTAQGTGCKKCRQTGYRGRMGLYELLEVSTEVRDLINRRALEEEVRAMVLSQGFKTLYHDGLTKVCQGVVSLEEVQRVCKTI